MRNRFVFSGACARARTPGGARAPATAPNWKRFFSGPAAFGRRTIALRARLALRRLDLARVVAGVIAGARDLGGVRDLGWARDLDGARDLGRVVAGVMARGVAGVMARSAAELAVEPWT